MKRNEYQITNEIIKFFLDESLRKLPLTKIFAKLNLSAEMEKNYFKKLQMKGYLIKVEKRYFVTDKGIQYVKAFHRFLLEIQ